MKNIWFFTIMMCFTVVGCDLLEEETFPEPPDSYTEIAEPVNLEFKVNDKDGISVELSLIDASESNDYYCLFELSDGWLLGKFGLVLTGMSGSSLLENYTGIPPDISRFEKDNRGNNVSTYLFEQTLVEDDEEQTYIRMTYKGPDMPLIESLQVERNMSPPGHISKKFGIEQSIEFQAGKYGLDSEINGFWIPVLLK